MAVHNRIGVAFLLRANLSNSHAEVTYTRCFELRPLVAKIAVTVVTLLAARALNSEVISQAIVALPASTESIEYEDLASLRKLPTYKILSNQFGGGVLQLVRMATSTLGIEEEQVTELILASGASGRCGLFGGTFTGSVVTKRAVTKGIPHIVNDGRTMFCPAGGLCILFLEDTVGAFGNPEQLLGMLESRQGGASSLRSNKALVDRMSETDRRAPVRGAAQGDKLRATLAEAFHARASYLNWPQYSEYVSSFGYSVNFGAVAHVSASLECKTKGQAAVFAQMLSALVGLQRVASQTGSAESAAPFQNIQLSSSDRIIHLKMDTPLADQ